MKTTITGECRLCQGRGKRLIVRQGHLGEEPCVDCNGTGERQYTQLEIDTDPNIEIIP